MSWYRKIKDRIPGGLADEKSVEDFDSTQLQKGIKVELEHTSDVNIATEIAMDHLTEDPLYYDKLEMVEKHAFTKKAQDSIDCLYEVLHKPLDYLPIKYMTEKQINDIQAWAKSKGLKHMYLYNREPDGALYVYNPVLLSDLIEENKAALNRAGVPTDINQFLIHIDSQWVGDGDAYQVIDKAFG